jgi:hypothetical protein
MTYHADTWRLKSGSASWDYELTDVGGAMRSPSEAYARLLERFLAVCQGFAVPTTVRLTTAREGEDTHVADVRDPDQRSELDAVMMARDDVEDVEISLTLVYEPATGGREESVPGGATVWLSREASPDDGSASFRLLVTLHADLYAFVSWGKQRDNAVLAGCNAPRLQRFLHRIEEELGGTLMDIDAPSYQGQVYQYGFHPSV